MAQNGTQPGTAQASTQPTDSSPAHSMGDREYSLQLTKADLDDSLTNMYDNIAKNSNLNCTNPQILCP